MFPLDGERRIAVGRLGCISFPRGWYAYVGSAMAGLEKRLRHHLRSHKPLHWHIDYLLPKGAPTAIIVGATPRRRECALASALSRRLRVFHRFGSSDCRCAGHLFQADSWAHLSNTVLVAFKDLGCAPEVIWASSPAPSRQGRTTFALILPLVQVL